MNGHKIYKVSRICAYFDRNTLRGSGLRRKIFGVSGVGLGYALASPTWGFSPIFRKLSFQKFSDLLVPKLILQCSLRNTEKKYSVA